MVALLSQVWVSRPLAMVAMVWVSLLQAQAPTRSPAELDRVAREVASELRCPVCQGLSIQDSPSQLALEMKALVRDQLASGQSPAEVRAYFVEKYGEWVLLEPEPVGVNLLVYILPALLVLVGGVVVWRSVRKWTAAPPADDLSAEPPKL
jgi:cytochrome c-type biogenesis protein CcmH